jgi:hypothetical protein
MDSGLADVWSETRKRLLLLFGVLATVLQVEILTSEKECIGRAYIDEYIYAQTATQHCGPLRHQR